MIPKKVNKSFAVVSSSGFTYYFDDPLDLEGFIAASLLSDQYEPTGMRFRVFQKESDSWLEQEVDPYHYFGEDLSETAFPEIHEYLIENFGFLDRKILWEIGQGRFDAIDLIEDPVAKERIQEELKSFLEEKAYEKDDDFYQD
jgi:hypothetical protein